MLESDLMALHSNKIKISISWSGGKDSSLMLQLILSDARFHIVELHTLINEETNRVGLHGIHKSLIEAQADSLNLPLKLLYTKASSTNKNYEEVMESYYSDCKNRDISHIAFGDIFLEDLKMYRNEMLNNVGLTGHYPLWKQNTKTLSERFIENGFKSVICAADSGKISLTINSLSYNKTFLQSLHHEVDPCGENGEFHSYVFDGPIFNHPIQIKIGEIENHSYEYKNQEGTISETSFDFVEIVLDL